MLPNRQKRTWKTAATVIAVSCACALSVPLKSNAMAQCCGEAALLSVILETMETNFMMVYMYMISGEGDVGTGLVGTMSANAQSQASHDETQLSNQEMHYQAVARSRKAEMIAADTLNQTVGDSRQCVDTVLASNMGVRGATTDAQKASAQASAKLSTTLALNRISPSESSYGGTLIKDLSTYCSETDALAKRCSAGSLPDANIRAQSVLVPASDYTKPADVVKQSQTFDAAGGDQQLTAAIAASSNIMGTFSPPVLPKAVAESPAGRMYTAKYKIYEARLSAGEAILAGMVGRRAPSETAKTWDAQSSEYSSIFPGVSKPTKPSELETLRYEVMRRYAGSQWQADLRASGDVANTMKERLYGESVELKILYEIHTRMEEQAAVRSAILSQLVSPISKKEVVSDATGAYRSKQ